MDPKNFFRLIVLKQFVWILQNYGQTSDRTVAAEFATKVAMAARSGSESTNSSSLQQASSRTSNYSENESQASPDPRGNNYFYMNLIFFLLEI